PDPPASSSLSLHDALPILPVLPGRADPAVGLLRSAFDRSDTAATCDRTWLGGGATGNPNDWWNPLNWSPEGVPVETDNVCITGGDRKSTRLNSSHDQISYA